MNINFIKKKQCHAFDSVYKINTGGHLQSLVVSKVSPFRPFQESPVNPFILSEFHREFHHKFYCEFILYNTLFSLLPSLILISHFIVDG